MKHKISSLLVLLLVTGSVLPACSSAPGWEKCEGGLCVDIELAEPIRANEPVLVTITVESREEDFLGLNVYLGFSAPDVQAEGERKWVIDLKAHTSMQFSTTIRFPDREGYFSVYADLYDPHIGRVVRDAEDVQMTAWGGTLNPPAEREFGTPAPLEQLDVTPALLTPSSPLPAPSPTPFHLEERPTPWARSLPRLQPDETLTRCGWSAGAAPPTLWEGAKVWVEIPEQVPLDTPVHVVVGFEIEAARRQARPQEARLALCLDEPGAVVEERGNGR